MDNNCDASKRACSASHGTARKALSFYDVLLHSLKPLCTVSRTKSPAHPHPGAAPAGTRTRANAPTTCAPRSCLALLIRGYDVSDSAILQEVDTTVIYDSSRDDTTVIGKGRAAWAIFHGHGQPPRTGLTNINSDSKWSSLRLSDVDIDECNITTNVAKIKLINLERKLTRQYSNNERRLKFLSMIAYPAQLATKAQEELQRTTYKNGNVPSLPLTVKAFDELWREAFRNNMTAAKIRPNATKVAIALTQCMSTRHHTSTTRFCSRQERHD
eukprot:6179293-Pleurochrysis_carterae.AAC.2